MTGRAQPLWSVEAEQSVLGALLLFPDAGPAIEATGIAAGDFFDERHATIWAAISRCRERCGASDPIGALDELRSTSDDARCGGLQYLQELTQGAVSVGYSVAHARIVMDKARRRALVELGEAVSATAATSKDEGALRARLSALSNDLQRYAEPGTVSVNSSAFHAVELMGMEAAEVSAVQWAWDAYIPCGQVALLAAHGGTGKSTIALHLAACVALGRPYLGRDTRAGRVVFYSAEDPHDVVLRRLARICRAEGIDVAALDDRLLILDATDGDPVLFALKRIDGMAHGLPTPTHEALAEYMERHDVDLLIVDNASDVFDADEINRTHVRSFLRGLVRLVRQRQGAVLLLAHVSKTTSRAGRGPSDGESYSGSTQWHNGVRSRLTLVELARIFHEAPRMSVRR